MSHILVIDDDSSICLLLRKALEALGHQVTVAYDGQKGLAALKVAPADLVITDLIMPGMEGIETILELKRRSPGLKIIAMSGGGMGKGTDYLLMAQKFGAQRTITKTTSRRTGWASQSGQPHSVSSRSRVDFHSGAVISCTAAALLMSQGGVMSSVPPSSSPPTMARPMSRRSRCHSISSSSGAAIKMPSCGLMPISKKATTILTACQPPGKIKD